MARVLRLKDNSNGMTKSYEWLLVVIAGVLIIPLLWAANPAKPNFLAAQACLAGILMLLSFAAWSWWRRNRRTTAFSAEAITLDRALGGLLWVVGVGLSALIVAASRTEHWEQKTVARAMAFGVLVAGAAFISGALLGILFGARPVDSKTSNIHPRTNLEEIADWLTKIILGAGLVGLTKLPPKIGQFASYMAEALGEFSYVTSKSGQREILVNAPITLAVMGFFSTCGILYGYLWTRYEAATASDPTALDGAALDLVDHWLNDPQAQNDQKRQEVMNAIRAVSSAAQLRILLQVAQHRQSLEEDANERALPLLQALVEADAQEVFHRNRSQCAFALMGRKKKDPKNPDADWHRALGLLNDAIRIRDFHGEKGWSDYEIQRAVCQIKLDANFNQESPEPSEAEARQSIRADLDRAGEAREAVTKTDKSLIDSWEELNKQAG